MAISTLNTLFDEWHRLQAVIEAWPEADEAGSGDLIEQVKAIEQEIYGAPIHDIHDLVVKARLHQLITEHSDDPQGRDVILVGRLL